MSQRRLFISLGVGFGIFVMMLLGLRFISNHRQFQLFGEVITRVPTTKKWVALTFDDGPTLRYLPQILRSLREHQARATFFVVGQAAKQHPRSMRQIVQAGHELGNHSYTHARMLFQSQAWLHREIEQTTQLIRQAGQQGAIHFRPPYGKKLVTLPWYLAKHRIKNIMWDVEPESFPAQTQTPTQFAAYVLQRIKPGSIVLMHVMFRSRRVSRQALPLILKGLQKRGYRCVTVSTLLAAQKS